MSKLDLPFNIKLLNLEKEKAWTGSVTPVTSQDIFVGKTRNLHPQGLFSTEIFGTPGTPMRYSKESWIDLKVQILHPLIHKALLSLKSLYGEIMAARAYAVWDNLQEDFVESDAANGQTGYTFFIKYFRSIKHKQTDSLQRKEKITLIERYLDDCLTSIIYIMPAGYRDVEIDDTGRVTSDEINEKYSTLIGISNTISEVVAKNDIQAYDRQRVSLQRTFNEIYQMAVDIIRGKNNLMMSKWAGRKVFHSTRNVLTAMDTTSTRLDDPNAPGFNDTMVGMLQFMKTTLPVTLHHLKTGFLSTVFINPSAPAVLTDVRTLKSASVPIKTQLYDKWMSNEGLEKVINSYRESTIRSSPIYVNGRYLGLVLRGEDGTYKFIHGIDDIPPGSGYTAQQCSPITYNDLFYEALWRWAAQTPVLVTRYPIATNRSTYPSMAYLMSTVKSEARVMLDGEFKPDYSQTAPRFPITGSATYDSQAPHAARLEDLGADHDGDTGSLIAVLSNEAKAEVAKLMNDKSFYIGPDGQFVANCNTATIKYVMANMTM